MSLTLKYDRQIVAIAKVHQATTIYSDDEDIEKVAAESDIPVIGLADIPVPDAKLQRELFLKSDET